MSASERTQPSILTAQARPNKAFRGKKGSLVAMVKGTKAVDVVIIRIIFLIALICGSAGFWNMDRSS